MIDIQATKNHIGKTMEAKKAMGWYLSTAWKKLTMNNTRDTLKERLNSAFGCRN